MYNSSLSAPLIPVVLASVPLAGYLTIQLTYWTKFYTHRLSGQMQFFSSSIAGVIAFAVARLTVLVVDQFSHPCIRSVIEIWRSYAPFPHSEILFLSVVSGIVFAGCSNIVCGKYKSAITASNQYGDLIECLLQDCMERDKLAELSLRNGKSYVGFIQNSGVASFGDSDIAVVPLASGYRDSESKIMTLTTFYADILNESDRFELQMNDFRVVFPMQEVVSVRLFDPKVYQKVFAQRTKGKQPDPSAAEHRAAL